MWKEKIRKYFTDYRYIISLQIIGMLILRDTIQDVLYLFSGFQSTVWNVFSAIVALYALCIFIYELVHKKLFFNSIQNFLWVFFAITLVGTVMRRDGTWIRSWIYEFLLFFEIYISFILIPRLGKEETDQFLYRISKWAIILFCTLNTISLLIWLLHMLGFPDIPGIFAYSSMITTSNHPGDYQFFGLYEWVTDGSHRTITALVLGLFLYARKQIKPFWLYLNFLTAFAYLLLAGARSTMLSLIPIVLYLLFLGLEKWFSRKIAERVLLGLLLAGMIIAVVKIAGIFQGIEWNLGDLYDTFNEKSNGRLILWKSGIEVGMQKPIFGWGWAYFPEELIEKSGYVGGVSLHNVIINVFVFSGFAGVISLLVFFVASLVRLWKNRHLIASTNSGWVLVLVICGWIQSMLQPGILGENSHIESIYFWISYGYLVYLGYGADRVKKAAVDA